VANLFSPDLEASLDHIRAAPADAGTLEMIVRRPTPGSREIVETGELDTTVGLVGDSWGMRERVEFLRGSFSVVGRAGRGTTIRASFPTGSL